MRIIKGADNALGKAYSTTLKACIAALGSIMVTLPEAGIVLRYVGGFNGCDRGGTVVGCYVAVFVASLSTSISS
jgi:hypothetical protein